MHQETNFIADHPDAMLYVLVAFVTLIGGLVSIVSFFAILTLKTINANQKELFKRLCALELHFWQLSGEHNVQHGQHQHHRSNDPVTDDDQ